MASVPDTIAFASLRGRGTGLLIGECTWLSASPTVHRGAMNEHGTVTATCSTRYLRALALDLLRARAFAYVSVSQPDIDIQQHVKRCQFLEVEIARLVQHPNLFPSAVERGRFLALLAVDSEYCFVTACKDLLVEKELRNWHSSWKKRCRPYFAPGSKEWENFLTPGAPGVGFHLQTTEPKSCLQVMPGIAMAIIDEAERMDQLLVNAIQNGQLKLEVNPALQSAAVAAEIGFGSQNTKQPIELHHEANVHYNRRVQFRDSLEPKLNYVYPGAQDLSGFPELMRRLERHPALPLMPQPRFTSRTTWTAIFLRSWHARHGAKKPKVVQKNVEHIAEQNADEIDKAQIQDTQD